MSIHVRCMDRSAFSDTSGLYVSHWASEHAMDQCYPANIIEDHRTIDACDLRLATMIARVLGSSPHRYTAIMAVVVNSHLEDVGTFCVVSSGFVHIFNEKKDPKASSFEMAPRWQLFFSGENTL